MIRFVSAVMLTFFLFGCAVPRNYTEEDLASRQAKSSEGTVAKQSRGSFVLKDQSGEERIFRTGELTQYIPEGYRSLEGDTVRVVYEEVWESSGKAKLAVLQLISISVPERNRQLSNPIKGKVVSAGKGSSRHSRSILVKIPSQEDAIPIYIPWENCALQINGQAGSLANFAWEDAIGNQAEVHANRIPIIRGNAYLYEAERINLQR